MKQNTIKKSKIYLGDSRVIIDLLPDEFYASCITSPPYWGQRDYGCDHQIGAESDLKEYINDIVSVFSKLRKKLKKNGTFWLVIGDSYTSGNRTWRGFDKKNKAREMSYRPPTPEGLKPKDLIGIPWRVALALQEDGWYLRSDIIWNKPNCQVESVKDRPTLAHEYIFLFSKSLKYHYNQEELMEPATSTEKMKNRRSVWNVNIKPFNGGHFATFPEELIEPIVKASSNDGDVIIDPFFGSGTVGLVSKKLNRYFHGIEINGKFVKMAEERLGIGPLIEQ